MALDKISTATIQNFPTLNNNGTWSIRPGLEPSIHTFTLRDEDVSAVADWGIELIMTDTALENKLTFKNLVRGQKYPTEFDWNNLYAVDTIIKFAKIDIMDSRHWLKFAPPLSLDVRRRWNITKDVYYEYNYDVFDGDPSIIYKTSTIKDLKTGTGSVGTTYEPYDIREIFTEVLQAAVDTANLVSGVQISFTIDIPTTAITSTYNSKTRKYPIFNNIVIPPEYTNFQALQYLLAMPECQNYVFGVNPDGNWYLSYRNNVRTIPLDSSVFVIKSGRFGRVDRKTFRPEKIFIAFPVSYEVEAFTQSIENVIRADSYGQTTYNGEVYTWGPGEFVNADVLMNAWGYTKAKAYKEAYAREQFLQIPPITPLTSEQTRIKNIKKACLNQDFLKTFRIGSSNPLPIDPTRPVNIKCAFFGSLDRNIFSNDFENYVYTNDVSHASGDLEKSILTIKDIDVSVIEPISGIVHLEGLNQNADIRFNCALADESISILQETHLEAPSNARFWIKYWTQPVINTMNDLHLVEVKNPYQSGIPGTVLYYNAGRSVQMSAKMASATSPMVYTVLNEHTVNSMIEIISDRIKVELSDVHVGNYVIEGLHQASALGEMGGVGDGLLPQDWTKIESIIWNLSGGRPQTSIEFFRRIIPDETWKTKRILDAVRKSIARNFGDPYRY